MRYFIDLAYNGTRFYGWQRQLSDPSVQAAIEDVFSLILRQPIEIVGCGRTDTGVHAAQYFAHFDFDGEFPPSFLERANKLVKKDIKLPWIVSYDHAPEIVGMYKGCTTIEYGINYSAQERYKGAEVMFLSAKLKVPDIKNPADLKAA